MNIEAIKSLAYEFMKDRKSHLDREKGYIYYHGERVSRLSIELRKRIFPEEPLYDNHLVVASLFHDIGKGIEPHAEYGAILIKEILKNHCDNEEITIISDIVKYHQSRKKIDNCPDYIKLVQDADMLDHFGTMEVWLNFNYGAFRDASVDLSLDFYRNELENHGNHMRALLNYDTSIVIFDNKMEFLKSFIDRFDMESQGYIYENK